MVTIAPYVLHRHRTLWDEPNAFRPERFLPEARSSIDRFAYLPFGAGPRVCIGASFALQEAVIVLATSSVRSALIWPKDTWSRRCIASPCGRVTGCECRSGRGLGTNANDPLSPKFQVSNDDRQKASAGDPVPIVSSRRASSNREAAARASSVIVAPANMRAISSRRGVGLQRHDAGRNPVGARERLPWRSGNGCDARAATCGAWVTAMTWTRPARRARRWPIASATAPRRRYRFRQRPGSARSLCRRAPP